MTDTDKIFQQYSMNGCIYLFAPSKLMSVSSQPCISLNMPVSGLTNTAPGGPKMFGCFVKETGNDVSDNTMKFDLYRMIKQRTIFEDSTLHRINYECIDEEIIKKLYKIYEIDFDTSSLNPSNMEDLLNIWCSKFQDKFRSWKECYEILSKGVEDNWESSIKEGSSPSYFLRCHMLQSSLLHNRITYIPFDGKGSYFEEFKALAGLEDIIGINDEFGLKCFDSSTKQDSWSNESIIVKVCTSSGNKPALLHSFCDQNFSMDIASLSVDYDMTT